MINIEVLDRTKFSNKDCYFKVIKNKHKLIQSEYMYLHKENEN